MRRLSITAGKPRPSHTLSVVSGPVVERSVDRALVVDVTAAVEVDLVLDDVCHEPVAVG